MRKVGRVAAGLLAAAFAYLGYVYLTLPDERSLRASNPTSTAFMTLRAAEALAAGRRPATLQRWADYGRISPHLKRAVLVAEDDAFWQHEGIDLEQIRASIEINLDEGRITRGASTITQQLAKNLYLSPSRNPARKVRELFIARRLEAELTKQRIFELYLNVIEWGDGIYGAEAAARGYFGKSALALDPHEAALLAGAIINPRALNPARPNARLRRREQIILRRMGAVTPPPVTSADTSLPPAPDPSDPTPPPDALSPLVGQPLEPEPLPVVPMPDQPAR